MVNAHLRAQALELAEQRHQVHTNLVPRSFLSLESLTPDEMNQLLIRALELKKDPSLAQTALFGKSIALLFQKTSTRTRCSFENAIIEMGGFPTSIDWQSSNFVLADLADEIKTLSRFYDAIVARVYDNHTLQVMETFSEVPIINGLCNLMHPCQGLTDYMTMAEFFGLNLEGLNLTYIGDGNNVCRSLVHGATKLGVNMTLCWPKGYQLDLKTLDQAEGYIKIVENPKDAVKYADVIYTDTWISMGDESETAERLKAFAPYQVNGLVLDAAPKHALIMHCLPAHPGQEITPDVLRSPRSIVFDQAENRKHAQKALLEWMLGMPHTLSMAPELAHHKFKGMIASLQASDLANVALGSGGYNALNGPKGRLGGKKPRFGRSGRSA